ncbi:RNA polymerase sigma-70 factor [Solitalea sp. MAHUQ-68]|uniref:RNA polymerase sigma-70 factor n=1 Tax=Solitalea agri TaxID=2953739 RepID=A0A9X2F9F0_9SPHI|nr:RNA polymerase sigma-70 factor [Solitalea agri]MCO4294228.1 RNA polymerase sigma-70 factor [Solitalea agri]
MTPYKDRTDNELVAMLKGRDQEAFTEIYNRYWATMYAHVYKMLRSQEESKDLLQDLFSSLWLKAEDINIETKLSGYLYLAARNRVFNLIQQNKVKNDYIASVMKFVSETDTSILQRLDEKELIRAIDSEIQNLPAKMREIFELSRKENLSHKEIAAKLNISDQTVRKQIQNALRILRPKINGIQAATAILLFLR